MNTNLPSGFVFLHHIIPDIRFDIRYSDSNNLFGRPLKSYHSNVPICTYQTAEALKRAQEEFKSFGFCLVIYDAYRPLSACQDMVNWVKESDLLIDGYSIDIKTRQDFFDQGYISEKSSHCRGSTVDATIIACDQVLRAPLLTYRRVGEKILPWLDDGTCDMGSHFDFMGEQSHTHHLHLSEVQSKNRHFFVSVMQKHGMINHAISWVGYPQEWWHFTLEVEPFPNDYFDFPVRS